MKHTAQAAVHEKTLRALCTLSNAPSPVDVPELVAVVEHAPDPESAVRDVLAKISPSSPALERKWRATIVSLWSCHHPQVPLLPGLLISSADAEQSAFWQDVTAYLAALEEQPAQLVRDHDELVVASADVWRLAARLPSLKSVADMPVESEWSHLSLRRVRAACHALRLVRPVKGNLVVVRTRADRFRAYPTPQQFYVTWHADTYHVDWSEFGGLWGPFVRVMQDYLPLLWELGEDVTAGETVDRQEWCMEMIETFLPLWEEEGLLHVGSGRAAVLPIVQQQALPTILDRFIVRDLLLRHGLISVSEEFGSLSRFTWTPVGEAIFGAELGHELPCGVELLHT